MEKALQSYGFKKNGMYTWYNEPYSVMIYYDGVTISKEKDGDSSTVFEGVSPSKRIEKEKLIEKVTDFKKVNIKVAELLNSTKSDRIYSSTALYMSNVLITYIKYHDITDDELCKKLNIDKKKLKLYLSGSYNFSLFDISKISVLIDKTITIK